MAALFGYFVEHRTAANLLALGMLLLGLYGAVNMRAQSLPDTPEAGVQVRIDWRDAGPEAVDEQIAARIDPALMAIDGLAQLDTTARAGSARFALRFEPGVVLTAALDDVRAAVDGVDDLPEASELREIRRTAFRDRVTDVAIWGPASPDQLHRAATLLQARLFEVGVTRTELRGDRDPAIRVAVREDDQIRHDVTLAEVVEAVRAAAVPRPAGDIADGAVRVLIGDGARTPAALAAAALRGGAEGDRLTVGDVADVYQRVHRGGVENFVGTDPVIFLRVERDASGDSIAIQRAVEDALAALRPSLPPGVWAEPLHTHAASIRQRLDLLVDNGLIGLGLVLGLLFLFLSSRTAFWVAAGIPVAVGAALGLMHLMGMTLNMISMFALILCLGVVVDDAIVVSEHADALARRGMGAAAAARTAAVRMATPVFAASVTTVIAFLGLTLVGGRFGALIAAIPLTVAVVLAASLVESLLILPAHMRHALAAGPAAGRWDAPSRAMNRGVDWVRERAFRPLVTAALRWRYVVIAALVGLLLHSLSLLASGDLRWRFFDGPERNSTSVNFVMALGAAREDARAQLMEVQRARDAVAARFAQEHGVAPLRSTSARLGDNIGPPLAMAEGRSGDLLGGVTVELVDSEMRSYSTSAFVAAWRAEIVPHPRLDTLVEGGERAGPGDAPIVIDLMGASPAVLRRAGDALKAELDAMPGVGGAQVSLSAGKPELTLTLTPLGDALGLDAGYLGAALRAKLAGVEAAAFVVDGRTVTVTVSAPPETLGVSYLDHTRVRSPGGDWVRLADVALATPSEGLAAIERRNGSPVATVSADIFVDDPEAAIRIQRTIEGEALPAIAARFDVAYEIGGLRAQETRFLNEALLGFALCAAGIYLTLAWVFASWSTPVVVVLAAPLGLIGVLWGHLWMDMALSMFSVVGLLGMAGIIINDSIVLVTAADEAARRRAVIPALIDAACDRLRAVFLTTATTVAGLTPMLFESARQAVFLKPTVVALVFGLGFGMALVLVATPAMIAIRADIALAFRSMRRWLRAARTGRLRRAPKRLGRAGTSAQVADRA